MIDEKSKRKDNFDEANSVPIVLADGQAWHFEKPWVRLKPLKRRVKFAGGKMSSLRLETDDPDFDRLRSALFDSSESFYGPLCDMAAFLLLRQYNLTDEELSDLIVFEEATENGNPWIAELIGVVAGTSPKPSGDGSD